MNPATIMKAILLQQEMYENAEALEKEPGLQAHRLAEILFDAITLMDIYLERTAEYAKIVNGQAPGNPV